MGFRFQTLRHKSTERNDTFSEDSANPDTSSLQMLVMQGSNLPKYMIHGKR
jgi:hypothetical protein